MVKQADLHAQNDVEHTLRSLLMRSLDGDTAAYRVFLDQLRHPVRAFLRRRLYPSIDDVDDLVQEIVFAVHRARAGYRPCEPLTAWVFAIARHKLTDYLRARSRHTALHERLDPGDAHRHASETERADARRDVETMLKRVPARQRMLIVWIKLHGLSIAEAAQMTGWSEASIKSSVHRGMKSMASRMQTMRAPPPLRASRAFSAATAAAL